MFVYRADRYTVYRRMIFCANLFRDEFFNRNAKSTWRLIFTKILVYDNSSFRCNGNEQRFLAINLPFKRRPVSFVRIDANGARDNQNLGGRRAKSFFFIEIVLREPGPEDINSNYFHHDAPLNPFSSTLWRAVIVIVRSIPWNCISRPFDLFMQRR